MIIKIEMVIKRKFPTSYLSEFIYLIFELNFSKIFKHIYGRFRSFPMEYSHNKIRKSEKKIKIIGQFQNTFPKLLHFVSYTLKYTVKLVYIPVCLSEWSARCTSRAPNPSPSENKLKKRIATAVFQKHGKFFITTFKQVYLRYSFIYCRLFVKYLRST